MTGFEPATSCSQSTRATNCATSRSIKFVFCLQLSAALPVATKALSSLRLPIAKLLPRLIARFITRRGRSQTFPTALHPEVCKILIFFGFSVSDQTCGQTVIFEEFERKYIAQKVSVYKAFSSTFARTFNALLFSAERSFARGGVLAGVLLQNSK